MTSDIPGAGIRGSVPGRPPADRRGSAGLLDPFGAFLPALLAHDLADRLSGRSARANARWGWLKRPPEGRRLVWIVAGATRRSVRLGVELARAIRSTRLDLALALTFEAEYPDLLHPLAESTRTGWGWAPADHAGSLNAALRRFMPFGVIGAGTVPRRNLGRAFAAARHCLVVDPPAPSDLRIERVYPRHGVLWRNAPCAPAADLDTLLVEAQVEATLAALLNGPRAGALWWWHGDDAAAARRLIALFRGHFPADVLLVGGAAATTLDPDAPGMMPIGRWNRGREPVPAGTVLLVDDRRWSIPLSGCVAAAHFAVPDRDLIWQAMAGGAPISRAPGVSLGVPGPEAVLATSADEGAVIETWIRLASEPGARRTRGDAVRRAFWQERRLAEQVTQELLDRVLAWN